MSAGISFEQVLAAAQSGMGWARARLYESLAPAVTGYARAQGVADPADLTSDVFVAVLTRLASFQGDEAGFRSWVFTIAYRRIADTRRVSRRRTAVEPAPAGLMVSSAEDAALALLGSDRVARLLAHLTPDQRQVMGLRFVADLTLEETATILDKPVGAVKALQHRALATLRKLVAADAVSL